MTAHPIGYILEEEKRTQTLISGCLQTAASEGAYGDGGTGGGFKQDVQTRPAGLSQHTHTYTHTYTHTHFYINTVDERACIRCVLCAPLILAVCCPGIHSDQSKQFAGRSGKRASAERTMCCIYRTVPRGARPPIGSDGSRVVRANEPLPADDNKNNNNNDDEKRVCVCVCVCGPTQLALQTADYGLQDYKKERKFGVE